MDWIDLFGYLNSLDKNWIENFQVNDSKKAIDYFKDIHSKITTPDYLVVGYIFYVIWLYM